MLRCWLLLHCVTNRHKQEQERSSQSMRYSCNCLLRYFTKRTKLITLRSTVPSVQGTRQRRYGVLAHLRPRDPLYLFAFGLSVRLGGGLSDTREGSIDISVKYTILRSVLEYPSHDVYSAT